MTRTCNVRDQYNVVYQSGDNGANRIRTSPKSVPCSTPITLAAVSSSIAWATSACVREQLLRTTDAGRTWHQILAGSQDDFLTIEALTTRGADGFSFVRSGFQHGGATFTLYRTTDAGRTWKTEPPPVPADLTTK